MRTIGGGNSAQPTSTLRDLTDAVKIEVANDVDVLVNLTEFAVSLEYESTTDEIVDAATVVFRRLEGASSLAPLMQASPPVATGRRIVVSLNPGSGTYKDVFRGRIDKVDWPERFGDVTVVCRDQAGLAADTWIEEAVEYSTTPPGASLESVMQAVATDNLVPTAPTLYFPAATGAVVVHLTGDPPYAPTEQSTLDALRVLAESIGGTIRWRHFDATPTDWKWTVFVPSRTKTVPDHTFGTSDYWDVTTMTQDSTDIRNVVEVEYPGPGGARASVEVEDATSITAHGRRFMKIAEASDSPINNATLATALANAALSDLRAPNALLEIACRYFWPGEVGVDLYRFSANGVHFSSDQDLAAMSFRHRIAVGERPTTWILTRGKPSGGTLMWRRRNLPMTVESGPAAKILRSSPSNRQLETVSLEGKLGADATGPLQWRYKLGVAAYTGYVSTALPQSLTVIRAPYYATPLVLELLQVDGQTATASYSVPSRVDESAPGPREDDARGGKGGVPVRAALFRTEALFNDTGDVALIDPVQRRLLTGLYGPSGAHAMDVVETGGGRGYGGFSTLTGDLVTTAKDSRSALINAHFRYGTDGADGVLETAAKSFVHPTYVDATRRPIIMRNTTLARDVVANDIDVGQERARTALNSGFRLITGATAAATAADGYAPMVSARGAAKQGTTARGGATEDEARGGRGGVPVRALLFNTHPVYNDTGDTPLIDPTTKQILPGLAIGPNVRGDSSVVFGGTTKFSANRHNEINASGLSGTAATFGVSYENIPEVRVLPTIWTLFGASSTVDRKIEFKAESVSVSGYTPRAVSSTGSSTAAQTENPATTINGTTAASQTITSSTGKVYWNLANANATSTTYTVKFDVDTTAASSGSWTVKLWKNTGTADDTNWSLVDSRSYDFNVSVTNETLAYTGAMAANYDFKLTVAKTGGAGAFQCTVTAYACTYDKVTAGTETTLTSAAGSALLVQAVEKS